MITAKEAAEIADNYSKARAQEDLLLILKKIEEAAKDGMRRVVITCSPHNTIDDKLASLGYFVDYDEKNFNYIINW